MRLPLACLLAKQSEVLPSRLADSERVAVSDSAYMLGNPGQISSGSVTGTTTLKRERAFLVVTINSDNKGAPIFNRDGGVIGIAGESPMVKVLVQPSPLLCLPN